MGLDLRLFAITDDAVLEDWAERFPESLEDLTFLHLYFSGERGGRPRDEESDRELRRIALEMERRHPGISSRTIDVGRRWDLLYIVLSPARRRGDAPEGEPGRLALRGLRDFHPMLRATQGAPVGYLPAGEVRAVLEHLISVTRADVEQRIREAAEADDTENAVYKFEAGSMDAAMEDLQAMIRFYEAVEEEGEAVLSVLD